MGETEKSSVQAREDTEQISAETGRPLIFILSTLEFLSKRVMGSTLCVEQKSFSCVSGQGPK